MNVVLAVGIVLGFLHKSKCIGVLVIHIRLGSVKPLHVKLDATMTLRIHGSYIF